MSSDLIELKVTNGVVLADSRDVAERFGKRHDHILRDIAVLASSPELGPLSWYHKADYVDAKGEARTAYTMTRDGFTFLVMGWTGAKARAFKVKYIQAFNKMESALASGSGNVNITSLLKGVAALMIQVETLQARVNGIEVTMPTLGVVKGNEKIVAGFINSYEVARRAGLKKGQLKGQTKWITGRLELLSKQTGARMEHEANPDGESYRTVFDTSLVDQWLREGAQAELYHRIARSASRKAGQFEMRLVQPKPRPLSQTAS